MNLNYHEFLKKSVPGSKNGDTGRESPDRHVKGLGPEIAPGKA